MLSFCYWHHSSMTRAPLFETRSRLPRAGSPGEALLAVVRWDVIGRMRTTMLSTEGYPWSLCRLRSSAETDRRKAVKGCWRK